MKFAQRSVIDLTVYDESGSLVVTLNSLKESSIILNSPTPAVYVKDALLDTYLLKFIGREERSQLTEFEKDLGTRSYQTTIVFGKPIKKKCKLIGKGTFRDSYTSRDIEFLFEIPNVELAYGYDFENNNERASEYDLNFLILPFNEEGDTVKLRINEPSSTDMLIDTLDKTYMRKC
jgi:hypothetical protein